MKKHLLPALLCTALPLMAEVVYDNTDNFLLKINSTVLETGDQVQLAGESRVINAFAFEYFATPSVATHEGSGRVRFYLNDGPALTNGFTTPGTLLYDSGSFLLSSNSSTVEISGLNIYVPSGTLTWTVQFSNIHTNERAGVLFYDPPKIGSSGNFLWEQTTNGWQIVPGTSDIVYNLSGRFQASPALRIKSLRRDQNAIVLTAAALAGRSYALQYKTSLNQDAWDEVEQSTALANGPEIVLTDPSGANQPFRIYRLAERATLSPR